ncbi:MAG: DUF1761 domain-containing protein [Xanthobacteraceae bacterium]
MTTTTNFLVMLGAAIAAWLFGALWYGTLGRQWVAAQDTTMEAFKAKQAAKAGRLSAKLPFVLSFAAELLMAYVLYGLMKHVAHTNPLSVGTGIVSAIFVWLGFMLTSMAVNNAFTGRKIMLTLIDAGHWLGVMLILGAVLGAFAI